MTFLLNFLKKVQSERLVSTMVIEKLAVRLFGSLVTPYLDYFDPLEIKLRHAQSKFTVHSYLSICCFMTLITFIVSMLFFSFFVTILIPSIFFSYTLAIIISLVASGGIFLLVYEYPGIKAKNIQVKIDRSLPFAVNYMATVASSGIHPVEIFKMLGLKGGIIGMEAERIYRDVKMLGMDVNSALTKAASRTPSVRWSELLWGTISVIVAGSDLGDYLAGKSREFMGQYRRMLNEYSSRVNFYTEIYITAIIVGTLFFIVLSAIMSPLAGESILLIQTFLVFFFIPLISLGFIILLRGMSPSG